MSLRWWMLVAASCGRHDMRVGQECRGTRDCEEDLVCVDIALGHDEVVGTCQPGCDEEQRCPDEPLLSGLCWVCDRGEYSIPPHCTPGHCDSATPGAGE